MSRIAEARLGGDNYLDHPLFPHSRQQMPTNVTDALDYCLRLWIETPMYRAVTDRVVAHFLTRLDFRGEIGSDIERRNFEQFFIEELDGLLALRLLGQEYFTFGTSFMRIHFPFTRTLIDKRDGMSHYTLGMFPEKYVKFDLERMVYLVPDPKSRGDMAKRPQVAMSFRDIPLKDFSKIKIRTLNPRYCRLRHSESTGTSQVEYQFTPEQRRRVEAGDLYECNRTPKDMLTAIRNKGAYLFNENAVFIMKEETIQGISNEGWGLPPILAQFPTIHRIGLLDRVDEALAKTYLIPFRVVTPDLRNVAPGDGQVISGEWRNAAAKLFSDQRQDPSRIHSFPFPFNYQTLGGEGRSLIPRDLRDVAVNDLYRGMGVPLELFDASFNLNQMPAALRLFEMSHMHVAHGLAKATRWLAKKISAHMYGEAYDATMAKPAIADDMERRSLLFNLYSSREVPARVAFDSLGLENPVDLRVEAQREQMETERRLAILQKEEEIRAQSGSIDDTLNNADSAAAGQGGAPSITPVDLRSEAEQLAQQWLSIPSDGERSKAMQQVAATNKDLYAVAKDIMEEIRNQGASQGRQMAAQQYQQG